MEIFTPPTVKEKRPPGRQSKSSIEYQVMIARKCIEEGMTYREAAKTFNVSHGSVYQFVLKYKHQGAKTTRNAKISKYKKEVEEYRHQAQIKDLKLVYMRGNFEHSKIFGQQTILFFGSPISDYAFEFSKLWQSNYTIRYGKHRNIKCKFM